MREPLRSIAHDRATFGAGPLRTAEPRVQHVVGSRASALLSVAPRLRLVEYVAPVWHTRPTSWHSRTALPQSDGGRDAPAIDVGAQLQRRAHQRGAEKTRGRAGSPTRATRHSVSLQHLLPLTPPYPKGGA